MVEMFLVRGPGRPRGVPPEKEQDFRMRWERGDPIKQMAYIFKVSEETIRKTRTHLGLPSRHKTKTPRKPITIYFDEADLNTIVRRTKKLGVWRADYIRNLVRIDGLKYPK